MRPVLPPLRAAALAAIALAFLPPLAALPRTGDPLARRLSEAGAYDEHRMVAVLDAMRAGERIDPEGFYNYGPLDYDIALLLDAALGAAGLPEGFARGLLALRLASWVSFVALLALYAAMLPRAPARVFWPPLLALLAVERFVWHATHAHPDALHTLLLLAAFLAARDRPAVSAAYLGAAFSTKQLGLVFLPALLLVPPAKGAPLRRRAAWLGAFLAVVLATQPRFLVRPVETIVSLARHGAFNAAKSGGASAVVVWAELLVRPEGLGSVLPLLGAAGILAGLRAGSGMARFGAAWGISHVAFLVLVLRGDFGVRHLFPLVPVFLYGAAGFLAALPPAAGRAAGAAAAAFLAVASGPSLAASYRASRSEAAPPADGVALEGVPGTATVCAQYYIFVPPEYSAVRFLGKLPDDFAARCDVVLRRPDLPNRMPDALAAAGFRKARAVVTRYPIEVWIRERRASARAR